MQQYQRDFLVSRIESGYLRYKRGNLVLRIYPPSVDVLYEANEIYNEIYEEQFLSETFSEEDLVQYLIDSNIWSDKMDRDFEKLPDKIDDLKVALCENIFKENESKQIRKFLLELKTEHKRLYDIRHSFDHLTLKGIASLSKSQFIIENSTFLPDGKLYDWLEVNAVDVIQYQQEQSLSEEEIREIAKTDPWSALWSIKKHRGIFFSEPLSHEQKSIIIWSMTYDIVHESPEKPSESVISDDDALDGWFVIQKRKRVKERVQSKAEKLISNPAIAKSQEILFRPEKTRTGMCVRLNY